MDGNATEGATEENTLLISIPCEQQGRSLSDCLLFLKAVYDENLIITPPESRNISIFNISNNSIALDTYPAAHLLTEGTYVISRHDALALRLSWNHYDVLPPTTKGRSFSPLEIEILGTKVDAEAVRQTASHDKIILRDGNCLLSGNTKNEIAHIVAFSWYQNYVNRMGLLDETTRQTLHDVGGINSVQNLMSLDKDYALAYDIGKFSIRLNADGQYEAIAISADYLWLNGKILYNNETIADIESRSKVLGMHPLLLQFQLKCAVLRNMKARGETTEFAVHEEDDFLDGCTEKLLTHTTLSPEVITKGLNWPVLFDFFAELDGVNETDPAPELVKQRVAVQEGLLVGADENEVTDADTSGSSNEMLK